MTEKQKEAIVLLNRMQEPKVSPLSDDEYFLLLEFVVKGETEIQYVPQPTIPWTTPEIRPYYTGTGESIIHPPYKVTCELKKD